MSKTISRLALAAALLATAACSHSPEHKDAEKGNLTRSFTMVDKSDGRIYGNVEMDPVGGGKIYDADGRLIGYITPPSTSGYSHDRDDRDSRRDDRH